MLNIVIVCGGTGSIQLQKGFSRLLGHKNYNLDVVINAYDNGKSTGECRKAFGRKILGASDLRKNQLTQFEIYYEKELKFEGSYESNLLKLFELRFSAENYEAYYKKSLEYIENAVFLDTKQKEKLVRWVGHFFLTRKEPIEFRREIKGLTYSDFALSNIFYSASAAINENSLARAGIELSDFLGLPDKVHLISDVNLFLKAETESGHIIEEEGEIVAWNNAADKIVRAILCDTENHEYIPSVDEGNPAGRSVCGIFEAADIIILSSGTQWSSLIPTYMHKGFASMLSRSRAAKYLVMNNIEDHDMYGVGADGLLAILKEFIPVNDMKIIMNENAVPSMNSISEEYNQVTGSISDEGSNKHDPEKLVKFLMEDYFDIHNRRYFIISDLDGTLWEERGSECEQVVGVENLSIFDGIIFSGNTYEHVNEIIIKYFKHKNKYPVYSDYGNTRIFGGQISVVEQSFLIDDEIIRELDRYNEFAGKARLRGGCVITIKPLENREDKLPILSNILRKYESRYVCYVSGKTSIDIMKAGFDKEAALRKVISQEELEIENILYVGNELDKGNEVCIKNIGLKTLQVNDVFEMNNFLRICYSRGDIK